MSNTNDESGNLFLDIPVCIQNKQQRNFGVSFGEKVIIPCYIESIPPADYYAWSITTSKGTKNLTQTYTNATSSYLTYTPYGKYTPRDDRIQS